MIHRLTLQLLLIFFTFTLYSQEWVYQNPFSVLGTINDIQFDDSGNGYAVGDNGIILTTENYGEIWTGHQAPLTNPILEVEIIKGSNGQTALAGGQYLFITEDGGETWERSDNFTISNVEGIQSLDGGIVFVSTLQRGIFKSTDGGKTFNVLDIDFRNFYDLYFFSEMKGMVSVQNEDRDYGLITTVDGGQTWSEMDTFCQFLNRIEFADENVGFMGSSCGLQKTVDGGETWEVLEDSPESPTDIYVLDENNIWVTWGLVYQYSTDGGQTWSERNSPGLGGNTKGVFVKDENTVWMTGSNVGIAKSTNQGMTWSDQIPGNKSHLRDIYFLDEDTGYAAGSGVSGDVLLTTKNGGAIWEEKNIGDFILNDMDIDDNGNVLVSGRKGAHYSKDDGDSWTPIPGFEDSWIEAVEYVDDDNIYFGLLDESFIKTDINGENQISISNTEGDITDINFINPTTGWAVTSSGYIYHTNDSGLTWNEQAHDNDLEFELICIINENFITAAGGFADYYWRTTDGGENWEEVTLPMQTYWQGMTFMDQDTGWIGGGTSTTGTILITRDGGDTWETDLSLGNSIQSLDAPIPGRKLVWASGAGGLIARFSECNTAPTISNLRGEDLICQNDTLTMEVDFADVDIFTWTHPETWKIVGNDNSAKVSFAVGTTLGNISVTGSNSCGEETPILTYTINAIEDNPPVSISVAESTLTADIDALSYQWYRDGILVEGAKEKSLEVTESGDYYVIAYYDNGCSTAFSNTINVVISSIVTLDGRELKIFPNPVYDVFSLNGVREDVTYLELYDLSGKMVRKLSPANSYYNISDLQAGIYLLRVQATRSAAVMRLVKQ